MPSRETLLANMLVGADALRIHPTRTLLSVLGIMIGCAALVATMAVSDGMVAFARTQVQRQTSVQVVGLSPRQHRFHEGRWVPVRDYPIFTASDVRALREQVPGLAAATLVLSGAAPVRYRGAEHTASVALGTASLPSFATIPVGAGRFFTDIEVSSKSPVVVLNHALARELAPARDPYAMVGQEVRVREHMRRVIGVLEPTGLEDTDNPAFSAYAPITTAAAVLGPPPSGRFAPSIQLLAPSVEAVDAVKDDAADWLARRYARWQQRVNVSVGRESLRQVEQAFLLVKCFVAALVSISLLVGGIGIMNVLLASVAERTREIGIRKSVGARRSDIRTQFLTESVAISLVGASVGLLVGFLIAVVVTAAFRVWVHVPVHPVLSLSSVVIATLSSSVVGLVFGTYPARRAAALPPILAIAHE
ncbi:MAG: ABC transporter permease [Candidatus Eisenbacteria bacterium]